MDKLKAEKAYTIINKKWLNAQAGKIARQGRSETPIEAVQIIYDIMVGKHLAPTQQRAIDELKQAGIPVANTKARFIMATVNDVFGLGCLMGVTGRNRK